MKNNIKQTNYKINVPVKDLTTFKTSGFVKEVFYPKSQKELVHLYSYLQNKHIPFEVIGNGSNILFTEKSKDLTIISLKNMKKYIKIKDNTVICSASVPLIHLFLKTYKLNLSGFEYFAGIPATIGGLVYMNGGAYGKTIFDYVEKIKVFKDNRIFWMKKENVAFGYRWTNLQNCLILAAKIKLNYEKNDEIYQKYIDFLKLRQQKLPVGFSAGSVFKNPEGYSAGKLIEDCGLKGYKKGDAQISLKHANIIINHENASYDDVVFLINLCKRKVKEKFNINLSCELKII